MLWVARLGLEHLWFFPSPSTSVSLGQRSPLSSCKPPSRSPHPTSRHCCTTFPLPRSSGLPSGHCLEARPACRSCLHALSTLTHFAPPTYSSISDCKDGNPCYEAGLAIGLAPSRATRAVRSNKMVVQNLNTAEILKIATQPVRNGVPQEVRRAFSGRQCHRRACGIPRS